MKIFFQKYGLKLATGSLFAGIGFSFLPEKVCPEKFKLVYEFYVVDPKLAAKVPLPVPQRLVELVRDEARRYSDYSKYDHDVVAAKLEPYFANTTGTVLGVGSLRSGAVLGLPVNYKFSNDGETERRSKELRSFLRAAGMKFSSDSSAESLASTLLLSDDAKRYAVSRTIHELSYDSFRWKCAALCCGALSGAFLRSMASRSMDLAGNRSVARGVDVICVGVALINSVLLRGLVVRHAEKRADQRCVAMGRNYVDGGYEFYEKAISRNQMLRKIGDESYNVYGNETSWFTFKMGTVSRFDHFRECCQSRTDAASYVKIE